MIWQSKRIAYGTEESISHLFDAVAFCLEVVSRIGCEDLRRTMVQYCTQKFIFLGIKNF